MRGNQASLADWRAGGTGPEWRDLVRVSPSGSWTIDISNLGGTMDEYALFDRHCQGRRQYPGLDNRGEMTWPTRIDSK
jgi:hypothetical protein